MTDQDNLRDRIAESQRRVLNRRALIADVDLPAYLAQAIIDEFDLTVDDGTAWVDAPAGPIPVPATRVVGKWEKQ